MDPCPTPSFALPPASDPPGFMIWWLELRYPFEANFLFGVFSPLISAEACEKNSRCLWKESFVSAGVRKSGKTPVFSTL